jgi:SecD/SecF fusion protein
VTHAIFDHLQRRKRITELRMRGTPEVPNIAWTGPMMRKAVIASALAIAGGVLVWEAAPETVRYDLDFTQGSKLVMRFSEPVPSSEVREKLEAAARANAAFADVAVRATAEGIGQQVRGDASAAFELRSQKIATREAIDGFKHVLQEAFPRRLLPGPFSGTLGPAPGGGVAGEIYFLSDRVRAGLVEAALRQFAEREQKLEAAAVEELPIVPGAGAALRLTFPRDQNASAVVVNVGRALAAFDLAQAKQRLDEVSKSDQSTPAQQEDAKRILAQIEGYAETDITGALFEECDPFPLADLISPSTAQEHRDAAVKAIALSLLGIIAYVAFRFRSWVFGFAAVMALVHDVLVTLGFVAIVNWTGLFDARLNLVTVAAFLTLIGYSINDTIVVFDRIRENRGASGRARLAEVIDKSVNQTLSRTIRTSATTWIVVAILLVLNYGSNSALEGFAFILVFGVLIGTYSTVFIASPTLLYLPWLWEASGSTIKGIVRRSAPYMVVLAAVLIGYAYLQAPDEFRRDWSMPVFNNLFLALPAGALAFFLVNFVRFVRAERAPAA